MSVAVWPRKAPLDDPRVLLVANVPDASVVLDSQPIGTTLPANRSLEIKLAPGRHLLRVWKPGFQPVYRDLFITANTVEAVGVILERIRPAVLPAESGAVTNSAREDKTQVTASPSQAKTDSAAVPRQNGVKATDSREYWIMNPGESHFVQQDGGWVERVTATGEQLFMFSETSRTPEYIELLDNIRPLSVRLLANEMQIKDRGEWRFFRYGRWETRPR